MSTKRVEVATTDSRQFVKELLELGAAGATLPDDVGVFKGIMLRTAVDVPVDAIVKESPVVRVQKHSVAPVEVKKPAAKKQPVLKKAQEPVKKEEEKVVEQPVSENKVLE